MRTIRGGLGAAIVTGLLLPAGGPAQAEGGEIVIANQGHGILHLSLSSGSEFGQGVTVTIRDTSSANRRGSVTQLAQPRNHACIPSGETVILAARDPGPCTRTLRLTEVGRQTTCTFTFTVEVLDGEPDGTLDLESADPEAAFERLEPDLLAFWGSQEPSEPSSVFL